MAIQTNSKHIVIGGGSGFIGTELTKVLRKRGDRVTLISRTPGRNRLTWEAVEENGIPTCDAVINLAGKHILDMRRRWNQRYREEVVTSRVKTTEILVKAINDHPPEVFISTAGKCFYGTKEVEAAGDYPELDEYAEPMGIDFPAEMVRLWEAAACEVDSTAVRHVRLRIGIVLAAGHWKTRGILPLIRLPFSVGLGASIGQGIQPFPWIHIDDVVNILIKAIDDRSMQDRYNAVAPGIVSNREFTHLLAAKLRRPVLWAIPRWLVTVFVGQERASILLQGQRVKPKRTLEAGYRFAYPDLNSALNQLTDNTQKGA